MSAILTLGVQSKRGTGPRVNDCEAYLARLRLAVAGLINGTGGKGGTGFLGFSGLLTVGLGMRLKRVGFAWELRRAPGRSSHAAVRGNLC